MLTSQELLQQQLSDITEKQAAKTKPVELPKAIGISYNAELQRMINQVRADIEKTLTPQIKNLVPEYTADGWVDTIEVTLAALKARWTSDAFNRWAERIASNFVQAVNVQNQGQMDKMFRSFGINVFGTNQGVNDYLQATVHENVQLIKSIPSQYLERVETLVVTNMRAGLRPSAIQSELVNQFGVTKRRARLIARDQTSKASNGLARKRMQSSGLTFFKWRDSSDERVRSRHRSIANKVTMYGKGIYKFSDLPLNEKGVPIFCGDDVNCRCVPIPVLPSEVERNQKRGLVVKGVKR